MSVRGLLLVVMFWALPLAAQSVDQAFVEANQRYREGRFQDARTSYEKIVAAGYESPSLFYNLGNAWYKTGDIGRAVLNYERALRLAPGDEDIRHNLDLVSLMLPDRIDPAPRLFVWEWWDSVKTWFSAGVLASGAYLIFLLLMAALTAVALARTYRMRRIGLLTTVIAAVAGAAVTGVFLARLSDLGRDDRAVVLASVTTTKNSPDPKSTDAFVLHAGTRVQILTRVGEWWEVRLADGKVGWMQASAAEVI
jgi:tetratricopeptide (TPR) repeat protein